MSHIHPGLRIVSMKGGWQNRGVSVKRDGMPPIGIDRHVRASDRLFGRASRRTWHHGRVAGGSDDETGKR